VSLLIAASGVIGLWARHRVNAYQIATAALWESASTERTFIRAASSAGTPAMTPPTTTAVSVESKARRTVAASPDGAPRSRLSRSLRARVDRFARK